MPFVHRVDRSLLVTEPGGELHRLGSANDGGYVVAAETIARASLLLSFGLATNWDFERDAVASNPALVVDAFDHTVHARRFVELGARAAINAPLRLLSGDLRGARAAVQRVGTAIDYFRFFSRRIRHHVHRVWYNDHRDSAAIEAVLTRARAYGRRSVFAKIDIEGSEYRVLPAIIEHADLFTGLVVEFHDTDICAELFNEQMAELRRCFRVVHVHGNNYGDLSIDGTLPLTLEISFAHRGIASPARTAHPAPSAVPGPLDAPNDPRRADYEFDFG